MLHLNPADLFAYEPISFFSYDLIYLFITMFTINNDVVFVPQRI